MHRLDNVDYVCLNFPTTPCVLYPVRNFVRRGKITRRNSYYPITLGETRITGLCDVTKCEGGSMEGRKSVSPQAQSFSRSVMSPFAL
jgi:hypothetical protein